MSSGKRFASEEVEKFSTIELISELKRRYQVLSRPERSCVIVGPDYAGVSTQATFLRKEWGLCSITRDEIVKPEMDMSKLSEELSSFRCRRGFVLSHFPNCAEEAEVLDQMLKEKHSKMKDYKVMLLSMPEGESSITALTDRAKGHLVHEASSRSYNTNVPELAPQTSFVDDLTGEPLVNPQWNMPQLTERIKKWWEVSQPSLHKYYGSRIVSVDASQSVDSVSVQIGKILVNENEISKS